MKLVKIKKTNQVMNEYEFRYYLQTNDGPSFDELTEEVCDLLNVDIVYEGEQPDASKLLKYQYIQQDGTVKSKGKFYTKYKIVDMSEEERLDADKQQIEIVKKKRDDLLSSRVDTINAVRWESFSEEEKQFWKSYRQELLDISKQEGFPWEVVWPINPLDIDQNANISQ